MLGVGEKYVRMVIGRFETTGINVSRKGSDWKSFAARIHRTVWIICRVIQESPMLPSYEIREATRESGSL